MKKVQTSGMKLSEIRPCDNCGGKIAPIFYVIEVKHAFFSPQNVNAVLGLNQMFGGRALGLAETMAPGADEAVIISEEPSINTTILLCQDCTLMKDLNLAMLMEKVSEATRKQEERQAAHG